MEFVFQCADSHVYLAPSTWIDYNHPAVEETARRLDAIAPTGHGYIEKAFLFVRDEISHSFDIPPDGRRITRTASEALVGRQGFCYVKSLVFAALLRWKGIPCGLCYQLLRNDGPTLHGLNAVYIAEESRWVRLDTRGRDRPAFTLAADALYYIPDPAVGESDYPFVYADPDRAVTEALTSFDDFDALSHNLPRVLHGFGKR